ncbi:peptidoglycan editing factor PgeF [Salinisphaera hydrothermalis]|uniref:peptidoglycan editing factor PgeF n=1 Tax=Salinisphaera hydrothermalis TaxID=563188 RepID=UPI00333F8209
MNPKCDFLPADWPAPGHIRAGTTLRTGGISAAPFEQLNLGAHTGDEPAAVDANRARLANALALPAEPVWLDQVHGTRVAGLDNGLVDGPADAAVASRANRVAAVLTADCLPVVFCDSAGTRWAAAHAGWRGLAAGVLEATVAEMAVAPGDLLAWMGPAIGRDNFEVGDDVREAFVAHDTLYAPLFTSGTKPGKYQADIYGLARLRLEQAGVTRVFGGGLCTVAEPVRFYSYRRDGATGRMATLIWSTR